MKCEICGEEISGALHSPVHIVKECSVLNTASLSIISAKTFMRGKCQDYLVKRGQNIQERSDIIVWFHSIRRKKSSLRL
jgi:ribosome-binding protein aMBF1 (putative translation factor)